MNRKKLQIFVSSTFADMIEERQAAVQAILSCGHIPAGMELFTAGDESQMIVIKRWIEESDVYMLILGGRYGSIEPVSGKSYTQLEYEYALKLNKPLFSVVIKKEALDEKIKLNGMSVVEMQHPKNLEKFKSVVLTKMVKFFADVRDIKLAIHETISEFERRKELKGWIRGLDTTSLAEELARLTKENSELRSQVQRNELSKNPIFNGLSFEELVTLLKQTEINEKEFKKAELVKIEKIRVQFNDKTKNLFHAFLTLKESLINGVEEEKLALKEKFRKDLNNYTLIRYNDYTNEYILSGEGKKFHLKLLLKYSIK